MSFCAPYSTMGGKTWWSVVAETSELLGQSHRTPSLWWQAPLRVVLRESGVCVAEAKTMEELQVVWAQALTVVENAKRDCLSNSVSAWLLQELFAALAAPKTDEAVAVAASSSPSSPHTVAFSILQQAVDARTWAEALELLRGSCAAPDWWNARDGVSVLHLACADGKVSLVKNLVAKGADVNALDNQGWTPLHAACSANRLECAEVLLDHKDTLVMQGTREGTVPLHYLAGQAVDTGGLWEEVASALLRRGCSVDVKNHSGETPLMRACFKGRIGCASWLIKKGASMAGCIEMALRSPVPEEMVSLLLKRGATINVAAQTALAKELRVSDKVVELLLEHGKEEDEEFALVSLNSTELGPTDETPCGICGLPLGSSGPPLGCVICAKVRCGRCIKTFVGASICLTCSANTAQAFERADAKRALPQTEREILPLPERVVDQGMLAAATSLVPAPIAATSVWLWDRIMGAFQGWRSNLSMPGFRDVIARFSLAPSSVMLDAWVVSIRGVYFNLFAFKSVLCFALANGDTAKNPSQLHVLDMAIQLTDITYCTVEGSDQALTISSAQFGEFRVVPHSEPLHWMGNVCLWLWKESRSLTPDVRPERLGLIREPEHASAVASLFPQTASDPFLSTFVAQLSLHGGPPMQGRVYLTRHFLCFIDDEGMSSPPPSPREAVASSAATAAVAALSGSSDIGDGGPQLEEIGTTDQSPRTPSHVKSVPELDGGSVGIELVEDSLRLQLFLDEDVASVEKDGTDSIVVNGLGGLWRLTVSPQTRDVTWDCIRGAYEACAHYNCDPHLPNVLIIDGEQHFVPALAASLVQHSMPARVTVAVFASERVGLYGNFGCRVLEVAEWTELLPKLANFDVVVLGPSHVAKHASFPLTFLTQVALEAPPLPRVVVVAPLVSDKGASDPQASPCLRAAKLVLDEVIAGSFAPLELCVLRHGPFFQDIFHANQQLAALGMLHLPLKHAESLVPFLDLADFVECVRTVALFRPPALYFPGSFSLSGPKPSPLRALAKIASVVLDRPVSLCFVEEACFSSHYCGGSLDAAILSQWDGSDDLLWGSHVEMILGRPPTSVPQFLFDAKAAVMDQKVPALVPELSHRWSMLDASAGGVGVSNSAFLLEEALSGMVLDRSPWSLPMSVALGRCITRGAVPVRDAWIRMMHLFLIGPDRVGLEWVFWALRDEDVHKHQHQQQQEQQQQQEDTDLSLPSLLPEYRIGKDIVIKMFVSFADAWERFGFRMEPSWVGRVISAIFSNSAEDSLDLKGWIESMSSQKVSHLLHSVDCLASEQQDEVISSCSDLNSDRLFMVGPGHSEWLTVRYLLLALRKRLAECELLPRKSLSSAALVTPAALAPVVLALPKLENSAPVVVTPAAAAAALAADRTASLTSLPKAVTAASKADPLLSRTSLAGSGSLPLTSSGSPILPSPDVLAVPPSPSGAAAAVPPSSSSWICTESCPALFKRVRDISQVSYNDMIRWLGPAQLLTCLFRGRMGGLQEISTTGGRSGSLFFRARNGRYLLKTLPASEESLLVQLMPEYCVYLEQHPESLLPRFLALMRLQSPSGKTVTFVVMLSVFGGPVDEQYDLKGSKVARKAGGEPDALIARKDLDLKQTLHLGMQAKCRIMSILERDSAWLQARNICDYSLLVGIARQKQPGAIEGTDGKTFYFLGLIDTLTVYDLKKRGEHMYKSIALQNSTDISAVDSVRYRVRLLKYVDSIID